MKTETISKIFTILYFVFLCLAILFGTINAIVHHNPSEIHWTIYCITACVIGVGLCVIINFILFIFSK